MTEPNELTKLVFVLCHINDRYAAKADGLVNWKAREMVVTVDQGGKTIYAATLEMDSDALEAKCRLVRHELETMIDECALPILHTREAAA